MTLLPDIEAYGGVYRNEQGVQQDAVEIFAEAGFNVVRIHLFVNPTEKCCNTQEALELAKRYHRAGVQIYVAFHYSDTWANPGNQKKPTAWEGKNLQQLTWEIKKYSRDSLKAFYDAGINPVAVQMGNEVR